MSDHLGIWIQVKTDIEGFRLNQTLAPTQTEPPFKLTQLVVLAPFVLLGIVAAIRFRPEPIRAT
jgi:hypothetical protein